MSATGIETMLTIGNVQLENPYILGPMAGVCDLPFRVICREMGAGLVCMEMVSAKGILYKNKNTTKLLETSPQEAPVSLQLFGSEPEVFAEVIPMLESLPIDIIDINMGCPVPKIVNNGEGSALMKDPALAERLVAAAVRATAKPVTVKLRKGFGAQDDNAVEMAKAVESAGAAAVAVHGRTREQYYAGEADWDVIRRVKEAVRIPVIGNGDLKSAADVRRMQEQTGCDGFMIARGAMGNPWIFSQIRTELETGEPAEKPSVREIGELLLRHCREEIAFKGEYTGMREMRKQAGWYLARFPHSKELRRRLGALEHYEDLEQIVSSISSF